MIELVRKDKEIKERYKYYSSGMSCADVALKFGVSRQAVWAGFKKRNLKLRTNKTRTLAKG